MSSVKRFKFISEIIPNRLYFAVCERRKCPVNAGRQLMFYFNYKVDQIRGYFGPPHIGVLNQYLMEMRSILSANCDKTIIHLAFEDQRETTTNAMFLCGAFALIELGYDPGLVSNLVISKDLIV